MKDKAAIQNKIESLASLGNAELKSIAATMNNPKVNEAITKATTAQSLYLRKIEQITESAKIDFIKKEIATHPVLSNAWKSTLIDKSDINQIIDFLKPFPKEQVDSILIFEKRFQSTMHTVKTQVLQNLDNHGSQFMGALERGAAPIATKASIETGLKAIEAAPRTASFRPGFTTPNGVQVAKPIEVVAKTESTLARTGKLAAYAVGAVGIGAGLYYASQWLKDDKHSK